jgi:hypothetical protein
MPTDLLIHPVKLGPFRLVKVPAFIPTREPKRIDNGVHHSVRARQDVDFVKIENPKTTGTTACDPRRAGGSPGINLDRDFLGKCDKARVTPTYASLSDKGRAKLLVAEARPQVALGKCGALAHPPGDRVAPSSSLFSHGSSHLVVAMSITALTAILATISTPSLAQNPAPLAEWPGAEIADGVAFQGDGSVTLEASPETGLPVLSFWRPVLHDEGSRYPVAGRMDCRVAASQGPFDAAAFDPAARHEAVARLRKEQGYIDTESLSSATATAKQYDVIGRRNAPRSYYVLSYIMARDGARLIDIRRNCTFIFGAAASKPDVLPYVNRYTKISFAFPEQDT